MIRIRVFVFIAMPILMGLIACSTTRPAAYLLLYNNSETTTPVSVNITKPDNTAVKSLTGNLTPGLQELDLGRFAKGNYLITATTNNAQLSVKKIYRSMTTAG